jgi:hypothetical protein
MEESISLEYMNVQDVHLEKPKSLQDFYLGADVDNEISLIFYLDGKLTAHFRLDSHTYDSGYPYYYHIDLNLPIFNIIKEIKTIWKEIK